MRCPNCGADLKFNQANNTYVCAYCGFVESIVEKVKKVNDASFYNLLISYPETEMTNEKIFYKIADANLGGYIEEGQSQTFVLAPGPHKVFLKVGKKSDTYTIVIVGSEPVRIIYARGTEFEIQQPYAGSEYEDLKNGKHQTETTSASIISIILGLTIFLAPLGFVIALVDMCNSEKKGFKPSVTSITGLILCLGLSPMSLALLLGRLIA